MADLGDGSVGIDATARTGAPGHRALVLHGGGSAGNAWEIGVIAGLLDTGLDATSADLIVGTSAGATAAAQLTSTQPSELLAAILTAGPPQRGGPGVPAGAPGPRGPMVDHFERTTRIIEAAHDAADMRRRLGESALELDAQAGDSWSQQWRATVAARLSNHSWPRQTVLVTAVDARTGEPLAFDRHSGVDLVDAIAASTSSGNPYRIGDGRYLDGGYRRNENADLAAGFERVLVLSPFGGRSRHPQDWGMQIAAQVDELHAAGSVVEIIVPDSAALAAFGDNMMDLSARPASARAGYDQGKESGALLAEFWG